jgi:hypothetical protein
MGVVEVDIGRSKNKYYGNAHGLENTVFSSLVESKMHDSIRDFYLYHAKCINEVITPYIINSSEKVKIEGKAFKNYMLPHLMVRMSTPKEDKGGVPFHILCAEIVNPKTKLGFVVSKDMGVLSEITALDFAVFAEDIKNQIIIAEAEKKLDPNNRRIIV